MSTYVGKVYHPTNGTTEEIWEGYSWPCFFFGPFWYASKELWGWAAMSVIAAFITAGISWLFFPAYANDHHLKNLIQKGYMTEKQYRARALSTRAQGTDRVSVADELVKLNRLRADGALSQDEYDRLRQKFLQ